MVLTIQEISRVIAERAGPDVALSVHVPPNGDPFVRVAAERFREVCRTLRDDPALRFDFLRAITGVETSPAMRATEAYPARFISIYHLYSFEHGHSLTLHVDLNGEPPRMPSVADLWPAAEWHERESYDLMGIVYDGHPYPHRILLPEDWDGHPLRKDYAAPREYNGLTNE